MKKRLLVTAAGVIALGAQGRTLSVKDVDPAEVVAFQTAVESGSRAALQDFVGRYPQSPLLGAALGDLIRTVPAGPFQHVDESGLLWHVQYSGGASGPTDRSESTRERNRGAPAAVRTNARRTIQLVERASRDFENDVDKCLPLKTGRAVNNCVGEAMEEYAAKLSAPRVILPEAAKPIPKVVARAARRVKAARTVKQTRAIVKEAAAQVRKQIRIARVADDSVAADVGTRTGEIVASSLDRVTSKLARVEL